VYKIRLAFYRFSVELKSWIGLLGPLALACALKCSAHLKSLLSQSFGKVAPEWNRKKERKRERENNFYFPPPCVR
jgi:hypothetical protein